MTVGLTVVIPVFNECKTLEKIVTKVSQQQIVKQVIVIDDHSTDGSWEIIEKLGRSLQIKAIRHERNYGKGACLITASQYVSQPLIIIQDADLEYDPQHYGRLAKPIIEGWADVVYGSRFQTSDERRVLFFWHYVGNKLLTTLSNMVTNINLTDMETCFKMMKTQYFKELSLREKRFGVEPEITCKLARRKLRFYEVSISYHGRSYEEGKKIRTKDGFRALYCLFVYGVLGVR